MATKGHTDLMNKRERARIEARLAQAREFIQEYAPRLANARRLAAEYENQLNKGEKS